MKLNFCPINFKLYLCSFSLLLVIVSCSTAPSFPSKHDYKKFNSPMNDYFESNDLVDIEDFDLKGSVKSVIKYKPIKSTNIDTAKRSKNIEVFFNKEGLLTKKVTYHSGNYFFQGKKKMEEIVSFKNRKKELIENNLLLDTTIIRYRNVYDEKDRLVSTENSRNKIVYTYDKKSRIIKTENYKNNNAVGNMVNNPNLVYSYKFLSETHKTKIRSDINPDFNVYEEHIFYRKDGSLKKTTWFNKRDTTLVKYNEDYKIIYSSRSRNGKIDEKKSYIYNEKGKLVEENLFKYSRDYQTTKYKYDLKGNPIKLEVYDGDGNLVSTQNFSYTYDDRENWISYMYVRTYNNKEISNSGYITRKINYY